MAEKQWSDIDHKKWPYEGTRRWKEETFFNYDKLMELRKWARFNKIIPEDISLYSTMWFDGEHYWMDVLSRNSLTTGYEWETKEDGTILPKLGPVMLKTPPPALLTEDFVA